MLEVDTKTSQDPSGDGLVLADDSEQNVLGADVAIAAVQRLLTADPSAGAARWNRARRQVSNASAIVASNREISLATCLRTSLSAKVQIAQYRTAILR